MKSLGVVACSRLLDRSTFGQNEFFGTGDFQPCFLKEYSVPRILQIVCHCLVYSFLLSQKGHPGFFEVAAIQYSLEYIAARSWFRVTLFGTESKHW